MNALEIGTLYNELKAQMPPEGQPILESALDATLSSLPLHQVKALKIHGSQLILRHIAPHLPYYDAPEDTGYRHGLSATFRNTTPPMHHSHDALLTHAKMAGLANAKAAVTDGLGEVDLDDVKLTAAAFAEPHVRIAARPKFMTTDWNEDGVRKAMLRQLNGDILSGSKFVMEKVVHKVTGVIAEDISAVGYDRHATQIRELMGNRDVFMGIIRDSGLSMNTFVTLYTEDRLLESVDFSGEEPHFDATHVPAITLEQEKGASTDLSRNIQFGCPARTVRGLIRWGLGTMVAASEAVSQEIVASSSPSRYVSR